MMNRLMKSTCFILVLLILSFEVLAAPVEDLTVTILGSSTDTSLGCTSINTTQNITLLTVEKANACTGTYAWIFPFNSTTPSVNSTFSTNNASFIFNITAGTSYDICIGKPSCASYTYVYNYTGIGMPSMPFIRTNVNFTRRVVHNGCNGTGAGGTLSGINPTQLDNLVGIVSQLTSEYYVPPANETVTFITPTPDNNAVINISNFTVRVESSFNSTSCGISINPFAYYNTYDELGQTHFNFSFWNVTNGKYLYNTSCTNSTGQLIYSEYRNITIALTYDLNLTTIPSDVNSSSMDNLNFTLQINPSGTISNYYNSTLYYTSNTSLNNGCSIFYQKVCIDNGTYKTRVMSSQSKILFTTFLEDFDIFPGYYPYNASYIENTPHSNYTAYLNNNIKFNVYNMSTLISDYFITLEFNAINKSSSTASLLIYYCNSSYSSGTPLTNNNCILVDSFFPTTLFSHVHNQSFHQVIPITIKNVTKTQQAYFIFVSPNILPANGWNFQYVTNSNYDNTSFNIGNVNSWSNTSNIFDIHIHQFLGNDFLKYYAQYNDNGVITNTSIVYDFYNITNYPPSAPVFTAPANTEYTINNSNMSIFFNWTPSNDINGDTFTYNLSITDGVYIYPINDSIASSVTDYTLIEDYLTTGYYYPFMIVCDSFGNCDTTLASDYLYLCQNSWVKTLQPCINGVQLINYTDNAHCNEQYNLPNDSQMYESCTSPTFVFTEQQNYMIFLFALLIIAILLTALVSVYFVYMIDLVFAFMLTIMIIYNFDGLFIALDIVFFIISLVATFLLLKRS